VEGPSSSFLLPVVIDEALAVSTLVFIAGKKRSQDELVD
jgi:hypothetical protein